MATSGATHAVLLLAVAAYSSPVPPVRGDDPEADAEVAGGAAEPPAVTIEVEVDEQTPPPETPEPNVSAPLEEDVAEEDAPEEQVAEEETAEEEALAEVAADEPEKAARPVPPEVADPKASPEEEAAKAEPPPAEEPETAVAESDVPDPVELARRAARAKTPPPAKPAPAVASAPPTAKTPPPAKPAPAVASAPTAKPPPPPEAARAPAAKTPPPAKPAPAVAATAKPPSPPEAARAASAKTPPPPQAARAAVKTPPPAKPAPAVASAPPDAKAPPPAKPAPAVAATAKPPPPPETARAATAKTPPPAKLPPPPEAARAGTPKPPPPPRQAESTEVAKLGRESRTPLSRAPAERPSATATRPPTAAPAPKPVAKPATPAPVPAAPTPVATRPAAVARKEVPAPAATPAPERAPSPSPAPSSPKQAKAPASGTGSTGGGETGSPVWLKFARSRTRREGDSATVGGAPTAEYIGDRDITVARDQRAPTTAERGIGNARGQGLALPVPDGHINENDAPVLDEVIESPSPDGEAPESQVAGAAPAHAPRADSRPVGPSGLRLSLAGEISDAQLAAAAAEAPSPAPQRQARVRPRARPVTATAATTPTASPSTAAQAPSAWSPPVPLDDDFWSDDSIGLIGAGEHREDRFDEAEGNDVKAWKLKTDGAGWTELTVLDDRAAQSDRTAVSVRRTDLGVWFTQVDDAVRTAWRPPTSARALGYSGNVVLRFDIQSDGTVRSVSVVRSNTTVELEQAALEAVPRRVSPPPRGFAPLKVQYTFRYGNVTSGANSAGAG